MSWMEQTHKGHSTNQDKLVLDSTCLCAHRCLMMIKNEIFNLCEPTQRVLRTLDRVMDQEVLDWLSEKQLNSYVVIVQMDTSNRVYMTDENKNIETFSWFYFLLFVVNSRLCLV